MARYGVDSKLGVEGILQEACRFFGPDGLGLKVKHQSASSIHFEGGGGPVTIEVQEEKEQDSEVTFVVSEWNYQTKRFLEVI